MIKFRVWHTEWKEFVADYPICMNVLTGKIVKFSYGEYSGEENIEDTKYILLQSTGLKDKNGIEIYEGDIVKDVNGQLGYIAFLKQEMGYVIVYKNRDRRLGHRNGIDDFHLETIGNKYEHPHLLKE